MAVNACSCAAGALSGWRWAARSVGKRWLGRGGGYALHPLGLRQIGLTQ